MTKILITGHWGSNSRGCEAIVRCTVDIINRYLGPTEITIMSFDTASDRAALIPDLGNVHIPNVVTRTPRKHTFRWLAEGIERRVLRRVLPGRFPSYFSYVNRSLYHARDVVISVGGDNFSDDYGGPSHYFGELAFARSLGSLTVIWGASIGPFNKRFEKRWANQLRKVDLITVREDMSLEYLRSIGVIENVRRVADPAFLLPSCAEGAVSFSSFRNCTLVGIGMSDLVSIYGSGKDKYIEVFTAFGKALLSDSSTHLVLIPYVLQKGTSYTYDDGLVCQQLASRLPDNDRVTLIYHKNNGTCQMKHVIAQCDYFIGARTHSTIASLSSYVPTLSIGYSTKAYGINKDIFGHTDYVLPISDLDESSLMEKFLLLRDNRYEIVKQLRGRIPVIKSMAEQGGKFLIDMLGRSSHMRSRK